MAEISFTFTVPDDKAADVLDTITDQLNYNAEKDGTRQDFLRAQMKQQLRCLYRDGKEDQAKDTVHTAVLTADKVAFT